MSASVAVATRNAPTRAPAWRAFAELSRAPGAITAGGNVLAGATLASGSVPAAMPTALLVASSACLYGGGVALNDWFDRRLDADERPERPLPSGRVSPAAAVRFGAGLVLVGVGLASLAGLHALAVASGIGALALLYDAFAKSSAVLGPPVMGAIRGLNLLLGACVAPGAIALAAPVALAYAAYVAGITVMGWGESTGGKRAHAALALGLLAAAFAGGAVALRDAPRAATGLAFGLAWLALVGAAFAAATLRPSPERARAAVKRGVLGMLALDAAVVAAVAGTAPAVAVLLLVVPALALARAINVH